MLLNKVKEKVKEKITRDKGDKGDKAQAAGPVGPVAASNETQSSLAAASKSNVETGRPRRAIKKMVSFDEEVKVSIQPVRSMS